MPHALNELGWRCYQRFYFVVMTESRQSSSCINTAASGDGKVLKRPPGFEEAVLCRSQDLPKGVNLEVHGYDLNKGLDYEALLNSYATTGFQATHFARAVDVLNAVVIIASSTIFKFFCADKLEIRYA